MKLTAIDQIHISSVKSDSLRPGEEFEVSDNLGKELMEKHPDKVAKSGADSAPAEKAEAAPQNKAEKAAPKNK